MIKKFVYSILAGVAISLGCIIYLLCSNKIVGAVLFSAGILAVMEFKLLLFTGFVPTKRDEMPFKNYILDSLLVLAGNLVGTIVMAFLLKLTRVGNSLTEGAKALAEIKLNDNLLSIFILAILCGVIVALIVRANNYKKQVLYAMILIPIFIISNYEHVVANGFYLTMSLDLFSLKGLLFMLVCTVGNFVGGFLSSFIDKVIER